jgi:hypothetical protein
MQHRWSASLLGALALFLTQPVEAAVKKPAHKTAAKSAPKPVAVNPDVVAAPTTPGGFMVPKEVVLRQPTQAEAQANAVWNIRAGLNVAALQCQFSGYLSTVKNYNDFLKQHGDELVGAQTTLIGHFKRTDGARAANSFDQYTTRTYNSYSTLDAQYAFCNAAGRVGREVLVIAKGKLGAEALRLLPEIRTSLTQQALSPALAVSAMAPMEIPAFEVPTS